MPTIDPFAAVSDWRASLYRGDEASVDQFLNAIDLMLPTDWVRDRGYEQGRLRPDRIRCYRFDRTADAQVRLWLQRISATRVRGGPVEILRHPPSGDPLRIAQLVAEFADGCVVPAAKAAGVLRTRPTNVRPT